MTGRQTVSAPPPSATRQLRESEERFRLLVESVHDYAIYMLEPDGTVSSWNPGAERIKGYRAEEILGRHFSVFYPPEDVAADRPRLQLEAALAVGRVEDEGWRVRKSGERFWANAVISALYDETGRLRGFAKVTRDLTEHRKREEAEARARLHQESSRMKDDFLAIVSHELRTPLSVITGQAAMLRRGRLSPEQAERAWDSLDRNLKLQARLIDDLLDVSSIIGGHLTIEHARVDIAAVLGTIAEEFSETAAERQAIDFSSDADAFVIGDAERLRQVFSNVLSNALKFTPRGGRITVACACTACEVVVRVSDSGIGMTPDVLSTIFERFSQGDSTLRREFGGMGLGLAIARELVQQHGGTIQAFSEGKNRGATFEVRLPRAPEDSVGSQGSTVP